MSWSSLLGYARIVLLGVISFVLGYITIVVVGALFIANGFFALLFFATLFGLGWHVPPVAKHRKQSKRRLILLLIMILLSLFVWFGLVSTGVIDNEFTGVLQPITTIFAFLGLPLGIAFAITIKETIATVRWVGRGNPRS